MNEDIQKEMMFASGALVAFAAFLVIGGISEIADMAISIGAFAVSWLGVSYFIKNYGPGSSSKQDLEKEFQWYAGLLVLFLAIISLIGRSDPDVELTASVYGMSIFGFTLIWVVRSVAVKYFS